MAKCRNVAFSGINGRREGEQRKREKESRPVERRWRAGMNNVDSLFFRGIYQVGVPITRSFRSVVPPRKMRPEIAMHLCALVEDVNQKDVFLSLSLLLVDSIPISFLSILDSPLRRSDYNRVSTSALFSVLHLYIAIFLSIADFYSLPSFPPPPMLSIHPGMDGIIVKKISIDFGVCYGR